jgi:hypothetical protein
MGLLTASSATLSNLSGKLTPCAALRRSNLVCSSPRRKTSTASVETAMSARWRVAAHDERTDAMNWPFGGSGAEMFMMGEGRGAMAQVRAVLYVLRGVTEALRLRIRWLRRLGSSHRRGAREEGRQGCCAQLLLVEAARLVPTPAALPESRDRRLLLAASSFPRRPSSNMMR